MCYFLSHKVKEIHQLSRKDAIVGYKYIRVTREGMFLSPQRGNGWNKRQMREKRRLTTNGTNGIYALKSRVGARKAVRVEHFAIVKVLLWGTVIEYKEFKAHYSYQADMPAGFRAEHAEIVEIVSKGFYTENCEAARKRYRSLK